MESKSIQGKSGLSKEILNLLRDSIQEELGLSEEDLKLLRNLLEDYIEFKKLKEKDKDKLNETQKKQYEEDEKEMKNIISIILDKNISLDQKLKRVGRAPASSAIVKNFKKNLVEKIEKDRKKADKLQEIINKGLENGILGVTIEDFFIPLDSLFLNKETKKNKIIKEYQKNEDLEAKFKPQVGIEVLLENQEKNVIKKTNEKSNFLKSFGSIKLEENIIKEFNPSKKMTQVEAYNKQKREEKENQNSKSVGRTMSPYPPYPPLPTSNN